MENLVVKKVNRYDNTADIISIELNNGNILVASEDTGGEFALLEIIGKKNIIKRGSVIRFNNELDEFGCMYGIKNIIIDEVTYPARVVSEGGNDTTYLEYKKVEKKSNKK